MPPRPLAHKPDIAAVAAETVEEARTFAEAHGFVPAQFTACDRDADAPVSLSFLLAAPNAQAAPPGPRNRRQ